MNPRQRETLRAFIELQITSLWGSAPGADDATDVLTDAETFLQSVSDLVKRGLNLGLTAINTQALLRHQRQFARLNMDDRRDVLDSFPHGMPPFGLVSLLSTLGWLVIHSREKARRLVGFTANNAPSVDLREPPLPSLSTHYDLCIIGSGAGGSVVAAVAAAAWRGTGKQVLVIDSGRWISPADLSRRDDAAVLQLYKDAGLQPAAGGQDIDILQADVVGGGPYINNAIHLPIRPAKWQQWRDEHAFPIPWARLESALTVVEQELHLNVDAVAQQRGWRSELFERGAQALNLDPHPFPMAIEPSICVGHGSCNMGCPIGAHTGGLHRVAATNNASYFMRAIDKGALVHSRLRAEGFDVGRRSIRGLQVRDLRSDRVLTIKAREFVLAAGPIASSRLLHASRLGGPEVGRRMAANVVTPVYARFPASPAATAEPGIPMCYYVDRGGHLLQNWFHYPASLSLSLPGFHDDNAEVMREYKRLAACAVSVPTQNHGELPRLGRFNFALLPAEFEHCLAGMRDVANIYFAEGAERVYLPTKEKTLIEDPSDIDNAIARTRQLGPTFVTLATSHPQGGNAMRRDNLAVVDANGQITDVDNLTVADASLFPAGCGVNPQWTVNALCRIVAENLVQRVG